MHAPGRRPALDDETTLDLDAIPADLHGSIVRPADPDYYGSRQVHSAQYYRRPALIVRAADAADPTNLFRLNQNIPPSGVAH